MSQVHFTSAEVKGLPSCHFTPSRSAKMRSVFAPFHFQLAASWKWNGAKTDLIFALRDGVKWHDGKPFTSADVKCTWDMVSGLEKGKIRKSPRQLWFANLEKDRKSVV